MKTSRPILLATRNRGKVDEFRDFFAQIPELRWYSLDEVNAPEVLEDGTTFRENAAKKAAQTAHHTGYLTLADDSGLVVDALDGAPGVFSARYAGPNATDNDNNRLLLQRLSDLSMPKKRRARFCCVLALATKDGVVCFAEGVCEGTVLSLPRGTAGFGYDPLFQPEGYDKSFAELDRATKNRISHRAHAMQKMLNYFASESLNAVSIDSSLK